MTASWIRRFWDSSRVRGARNNIMLMIIALLAPELIVLWATRQRYAAQEIGNRFKRYGWGTTHGFFYLMGGFALCDGKRVIDYLHHDHEDDHVLEEYWKKMKWRHKLAEIVVDDVFPEKGDDIKENLLHAPSASRRGSDTSSLKSSTTIDQEAVLSNEDDQKSQIVECLSKSPDPLCLLEFLVSKGFITEDEMRRIKRLASKVKANSTRRTSTLTRQDSRHSYSSEKLLKRLIKKGYITITESEINDRSRADAITKSIAIVQTIWFLFQVGARAIQGLAITELEIITVGFAILNFATYVSWWYKPLRVQRPLRVYWKQEDHRFPDDSEQPNTESKWTKVKARVAKRYKAITTFIHQLMGHFKRLHSKRCSKYRDKISELDTVRSFVVVSAHLEDNHQIKGWNDAIDHVFPAGYACGSSNSGAYDTSTGVGGAGICARDCGRDSDIGASHRAVCCGVGPISLINGAIGRVFSIGAGILGTGIDIRGSSSALSCPKGLARYETRHRTDVKMHSNGHRRQEIDYHNFVGVDQGIVQK
ncbi:hypothetical protein VNI00_000885 [Paramarasmius palmivorus]|uniref:Uncharacterized protein n=1 Tax=Paramarasmius palmivorus TaxID=297713 RepID=A0AAW0E8N6_9AGAR